MICGADHRCFAPEPQCDAEGYCLVPAGVFLMGDDTYPQAEWAPAHEVTLTRDFVMKATEVTVSEWLALMPVGTKSPVTHWAACGIECPVTNITFFDMLRYTNTLSSLRGFEPCYELKGCSMGEESHGEGCERAVFRGPDCTGYRLPSEAEWEYAARAGTRGCTATSNGLLPSALRGSNDLCSAIEWMTSVAWYCANSSVSWDGCLACEAENGVCCGPQPVAQKQPNPFGLYDIHGNLVEWTGSLMYPYSSEPAVDPGFDLEVTVDDATQPRGGTFFGPAVAACSFFRYPLGIAVFPGNEGPGHMTFRPVRTVVSEARR